MKTLLNQYRHVLYPAVLLLISLSIYFPYYGNPNAMFWDENYHVASAQKHIDGMMYMEPHPPLGKMLMGLAEAVMGTNDGVNKQPLLETDYLTGDAAPAEMNYLGFRWPSTVMMAFSVLFFYGILNRITQRPWLAAAFSSLIIFDNALVVQSRAAMLEGIQIFFVFGALYLFVRAATNFVHHQKPILLRHYAWIGVWIGLATAVKVTSLVLVLVFVALYLVDQWSNIRQWQWKSLLIRLATTVPSAVAPIAIVFFGIFYIHIGMGERIVANKTYKASPEYLAQIQKGETWSLTTFPIAMRDNFKYMSEYADGVPRLDVCKPDENGSHAMGWPLSTKTISFRWDKETHDGVAVVKYKYLVGNPIVWFSVLAGIILASGLIISRVVYNSPVKDERLFYWICTFTGLYLFYMVAILQIERVMYLYHYMLPLLFGAVNLGLVFAYIYRDDVMNNHKHTIINAFLFTALVIVVFAFFSPFTYGFGLTEEQFELRNWFDFWKMRVVR